MKRRTLAPTIGAAALALIGCTSPSWAVYFRPADLSVRTSKAAFSEPMLSRAGGVRISEQTLTVLNVERKFRVHMPSIIESDEKLPLVIYIHCSDSDPIRSMEDSSLLKMAEKERIVVVAPSTEGPYTGWTSHPSIFPDGKQPSHDIEFFTQLIEEAPSRFPIDPQRIYIIGHRSGAMMSLRMAVELPDKVAGVGVVGGAIGVTAIRSGKSSRLPLPEKPIPIVAFSGEQDGHMPIGGGVGQGGNRRYPSASETMHFWIRADQCEWKPERDVLAKGKTYRAIYKNDQGVPMVVFYRLPKQDKDWPSNVSIDDHGDSMNATMLMWQFLKTKRLEQ